jgi:hypothetical protein
MTGGLSRYNPVEHAWSPVSNWLSGVTFDATVQGESKPPCHQSGLSDAERESKERTVFDQASQDFARYTRERRFDGFPVSTTILPSSDADFDSKLPYSDAELVSRFVEASGKAAQSEEFKDLLAEFKFILKHVDRRTDALLFRTCNDAKCAHCASIPKPGLLHLLDRSFGGQFPTPTPHAEMPASYMSYLEMKAAAREGKFQLPLPDEHCPSVLAAQAKKKPPPIRCPFGCTYVFVSQANADRHRRVLHSNQGKKAAKKKKRKGPAPAPATPFLCSCKKEFMTPYMLKKHVTAMAAPLAHFALRRKKKRAVPASSSSSSRAKPSKKLKTKKEKQAEEIKSERSEPVPVPKSKGEARPEPQDMQESDCEAAEAVEVEEEPSDHDYSDGEQAADDEGDVISSKQTELPKLQRMPSVNPLSIGQKSAKPGGRVSKPSFRALQNFQSK